MNKSKRTPEEEKALDEKIQALAKEVLKNDKIREKVIEAIAFNDALKTKQHEKD